MFCKGRKKTEDIIANGIRAKMRDAISAEFKRLVKERVEPWIFFKNGPFHAKKFDGSPRLVFWSGYIEPYIEDTANRMIEQTIELANQKGVPVSAVLMSTNANLSCGIDTVYHKMQDVDRRLRGKGCPKSVQKRDAACEIKKMNNLLDRQISTHQDLAFSVSDSWFKKWYQDNPHWLKLVEIALLFLSIIVAAVAIVATKQGK